MSENTYGKDLVDSLKEPVLEDPVALCAEAAAEIERLRASEAQAVTERERVCTWTKEDEGPWHTECNNAFEFTVDGPTENEFKHCCYCGGKIEVKEASDAER